MVDSRFFRVAGPFTLRRLAEIAEAEPCQGADLDRSFQDVAPLSQASAEDVSFLDNKRYLDQFAASAAGACVVAPDYAERAPKGMALLLSRSPYRAFARIAQAFHPAADIEEGIDSRATVDPTARIAAGAQVMAGAFVGARAEIGRGCRIGPNAVIENDVVVGDETRIGANAVLSHCLVGARVEIHPGVCIGQRGFGFDMSDFPYVDVPQLGRVIVEDDVEIGANSTVDRGAGPDTVIGAGTKIDNLVQIGHNCRIGRGCVLVGQCGVAGSTIIEDFAVIAAQAGIGGHVRIGSGAQIAAASGVMRDVPAGQKVAGAPAMPVRDFFRLVSMWQRMLKSKGKSDE